MIIILFHDFLPPPGRGSHVRYHTLTIVNIHPLAHIRDTCSLIFSICALFDSLSQPNHVTAFHQSTGGLSERTQGRAKWPRETHFVTYAPGLYTLSYLSRIDAQLPPSFLCCPRPPSHHPFSLTSVYLAPVLHLLPPSTPFWPYGTHPFFPHAQTISILFDQLYS